MTVNELIEKLQALSPAERELECGANSVEVVTPTLYRREVLDSDLYARTGEIVYFRLPVKGQSYVHIHGA